MNHSDNFYVQLGTLLCTYAAMAQVTYREVVSELSVSEATYSKVWKGTSRNFDYYRAVYLYIYQDLREEWQRERMTRDFLKVFHGD